MSRPSLVHHIDVPVSAEELWQAITDPTFTERYFHGLRVRSTWRRGARIVYETPDGELRIEGQLFEVDPPRRFVMSVRVLRDPETAADLPSRVTWEIETLDTGCRLTVVHDEFDGPTTTYRVVQGGWPVVMQGLQALFAPDLLADTRGPSPRSAPHAQPTD